MKRKKDRLPDYLLNNNFVDEFVDNFLTLFCKMNVLVYFDMRNFFQIFLISRSIELLIDSNYKAGI